MKQRLISAFFGIILLMLVIFSNALVLDIAVAVITALAVFEVMSALGLQTHKIMMTASILVAVFTPFRMSLTDMSLEITVFLYIAVLLLTMLFDHKRYNFLSVAEFFTVTMMLSLSFFHITGVRHTEHGLLNLFLIFIGSWITDTCAYFCGMLFGKHKLAPTISPKKTVEGAAGGALGTMLVMTVYALCVKHFAAVNLNLPGVIILGILCGIFSQTGDLCASIIKREHGIKDFGHIMPGHGGVMDRFDSLIFVSPIVYYFISFFPIFTAR